MSVGNGIEPMSFSLLLVMFLMVCLHYDYSFFTMMTYSCGYTRLSCSLYLDYNLDKNKKIKTLILFFFSRWSGNVKTLKRDNRLNNNDISESVTQFVKTSHQVSLVTKKKVFAFRLASLSLLSHLIDFEKRSFVTLSQVSVRQILTHDNMVKQL